jgi:putative FmdB family regulatory protein
VDVPTYPYACTACDHRFEQVQAFSDPSLTECPVCGGRLRKVFSSVGIVFKGSGFYRNDARAGAASSSEASSAGAESKGSSDGGTKTESGAKSESGSTSDSGSTAAASGSGSSSKSGSSGSSGSSDSSAKSA